MATIKHIELHSYYISREGNMNGIELYSRNFITINGPFHMFNKERRILSNNYTKIYLPNEHADLTCFPPVYQRTCDFLNSLCIN